MSLESANTISGLQIANPTSSDPVAQGDNHLRLIKKVLKDQFPGANGNGFDTAITPTEAELNFVEGATSNIQEQIDNIIISQGSDALNAPKGTILIFGLAYVPPGWTVEQSNTDFMLRVVGGDNYAGPGGVDNPIGYVFNHTHTHTSVAVQSGSGTTVTADNTFGVTGTTWSPRYLEVVVGAKD